MKVYVKLFASLVRNVSEAVRRQQPREIKAGFPLEIELPEESTLADLVAYLSLDRKLVIVTFVNGRAQDLDYHLSPEDQVGIFPPVGGG